MFVAELERERQRLRLTQAQMAARIGCSPRSYRAYVSGDMIIQPEYCHQIAKLLRSPRLALCALAECDNPLAPVLLNVDTHPSHEIRVALAELREAIDAIMSINPCTPLCYQNAQRIAGQVIDLPTIVAYLLVALCEDGEIDLWSLAETHVAKCRQRGYLKDEGVAA